MNSASVPGDCHDLLASFQDGSEKDPSWGAEARGGNEVLPRRPWPGLPSIHYLHPHTPSLPAHEQQHLLATGG